MSRCSSAGLAPDQLRCILQDARGGSSEKDSLCDTWSVDFDLTRLGLDAFERLITSLALETLKRRPKAFAAGVFGGLEGTFGETNIKWPQNLGGGEWEGISVVNIQFRGLSAGVRGDTQWFYERTRDYLSAWQSSRRNQLVKRTGTPYTLFVTNVALLEVPGDGLHKINEMIREYANDVGMKDWNIWHYRTLCSLLEKSVKTRRRFAGFITSDDLLLRIPEYGLGVSEELGNAIKQQVITELAADQWVRLSRVGNTPHDKLSLGSIGVDLPLISENADAVQYILNAGDRPLRHDTGPEEPGQANRQNGPTAPHIMLVGGPGQGKTTVGQLICQAYRVALWPSTWNPGAETYNLLKSHRDGLRRIGLALPRYHRWPIRIDLSNYGDAASSIERTPLLKYIAARLSARISNQVSVSHMRKWLEVWPWALVLDGLDEVASATSREILMDHLHEFKMEAELVDSDVFIVATTRPQGYSGEFTQDKYRHISLAPLTPNQAVAYAERLAEVRHVGDPDMRDKVIERTRKAADEQFTARLMRTPLQVTIMSILLEARERAPQARYALFEAYYDTIYSREVSKSGPLAKLLESRKNDIQVLHDRIGLLLQAKAEKIGEADASIPRDVLRQLSIERLRGEGYSEPEALRLADSIDNAVTRRLVLIVPKAVEDMGFEVRSVQEFMAARAIVSGPDDAVLDRLREILPSAHWRNTWLFAAGRIFSEREHLRRHLTGLIEEIDSSDLLHMVVAPGADLSLDLLDDDIAATAPSLERVLARHALSLFNYPPDNDLIRRADILFRLASRDDVIRAAVDQIIEHCLNGSPAQRKSVEIALNAWKNQSGPLAVRARQITGNLAMSARQAWAANQSDPPEMAGKSIGSLLAATGRPQGLSQEDLRLIDELISHLNTVRIRPRGASVETGARLLRESPSVRLIMDKCLSRRGIVEFLAASTIDSTKQTWSGSADLRDWLRSWLQRVEIADKLLEITPFPQDS